MHWIIGTAGHIDHGKTSLIKALTGQDTDRLPEEKERAISIDLGFAHHTAETLATLQRGHYAVEVLDQAAIRTRYPHFVADDVALAMLEPEGGVVMARRSVQALAAGLSRTGVIVRRGRASKPSVPGRVSALRLMDGPELPGALFVFALTANVTPEARFALPSKSTVTRRAVY